MPQKRTDIGKLIIKYGWRQELNKEERSDLQTWQDRSIYHQAVPGKFRNIPWLKEELQKIAEFPKDKIWQRLKEQIEIEPPAPLIPWWKSVLFQKYAAVAAAVIFIAISWTGWNYLHHSSYAPEEIATIPAKGKAGISGNSQIFLTLADSSTIALDQTADAIPSQGNTTITRNGKDGLILTTKTTDTTNTKTNRKTATVLSDPEYHKAPPTTTVNDSPVPASPPYNSITTRQTDPFHLTLPDGSKVTLCYASYLRYPVEFNSDTREVTLIGQAYFDITPDAEKPFIVHTGNNANIEVLGTGFNIMAYPKEPISAITVFKGSVRVFRGADIAVLHRLDQTSLTDNSLKTGRITESEAAAVLNWNTKNPSFTFSNTGLLTATRELARWYGVEIHNPDGIKGITITAGFRHADSLKDILQAIQQVENGNAFLKLKNDTILISTTK